LRHILRNNIRSEYDGEPEHPTILDSPEKRRKRIFIQMILFIVIFIIGISVLIYGIYPILNAKTASDINDDFDSSTQKFNKYKTGDRIIITGEITDKIEASKLSNGTLSRFPGTQCKIKYELDNKLEFYSNEDTGELGDSIIVECEVELETIFESYHFLKTTVFYNPILFIIVGIALMIFGITAVFLSYKKSRKITTNKAIEAYNVAKMYKSLASEDDEDMMYHTLRSKNVGNRNVGKISTNQNTKQPEEMVSNDQVVYTPNQAHRKAPIALELSKAKKPPMAKPVLQQPSATHKPGPLMDDGLSKDSIIAQFKQSAKAEKK
jgi:flagellar basal body-associated protein FliL